ncbi:MMS19 nucleotide excision repair protein homolog isoform X2 [Bacillus rossius redtenbacheri]
MVNLPATSAAQILAAIFQNVPGSSQTQTDRYTLYRILQLLCDNNGTELVADVPDLVLGIISMIDGERDPRNLLFIFSWLPRFIASFPLGHLVEEMFEVLACYFPVDFRLKADDPEEVSRDQLAAALQNCLVGSPQFSEWCLPLLLDKLGSSLHRAKLDSLRLLAAGCKVFPCCDLRASWNKLWHLLLPEMLPGTDRELREEAVHSVQALVQAATVSPDHAFLHQLLSTLLAATDSCICDAQLNLFAPAVGLIVAVSVVSANACHIVASEVVPLWVEQLRARSEPREREGVLQALTALLSACTTHGAQASGHVTADIVMLYVEAGRDVSVALKTKALQGLAAVATLTQVDVRPHVYQLLSDTLRQENCSSTRSEAVACLQSYAGAYPTEVLGWLQVLETQLDDDVLTMRCLDGLSAVAGHEPFLSHILPGMLRRLLDPQQAALCGVIARSLRKVVEGEGSGASASRFLHERCDVVSRVLAWWQRDPTPNAVCDPVVVADLVVVLLSVVLSLDFSAQSSLVEKHVPAFLNTSSVLHIEPFQSHHIHSVALCEALLAGLYGGVRVPQLDVLADKLLRTALQGTDPERTSAARLLACFVNKKQDGPQLVTEEAAQGSAQLVTWVCKALVMRGHAEADHWTDRLFTLLACPREGPTAARGFQIVLQEDACLSARCHCIVRLLYKQRFFQMVLDRFPSLLVAPETGRSNYHLMLAHLLQEVDPAVVTLHLPQVLPLLLEGLAVEDPTLLLAAARTLQGLLRAKLSALHAHAHTLVNRLLALAVFPADMKVRVAALEALLQLCSCPTHLLLPLRSQVLQGLGQCVDDRKRLVRRAAMATRNRWFLMGTSAEPACS